MFNFIITSRKQLKEVSIYLLGQQYWEPTLRRSQGSKQTGAPQTIICVLS